MRSLTVHETPSTVTVAFLANAVLLNAVEVSTTRRLYTEKVSGAVPLVRDSRTYRGCNPSVLLELETSALIEEEIAPDGGVPAAA